MAEEHLNNNENIDNQGQAKAEAAQQATGAAGGMSEKMKAKMQLVKEHFVKETIFGPKYDLKGTSIWALLSVWAFLFSVLYYLVKGMWRKAISLALLGFAINVLIVGLEITFELGLPDMALYLGSLLVQCICMNSAYYDIYRKDVLKETFWW